MNDDHELAALYVVDALTPGEALEFETHLADCVACQEEVADMRSVTDHLSRSVEADPPASLRASVLAGITATAQEPVAPTRPDNVIPLRRSKPSRLPYLVAAASVVLALAFGGWALQSRNDAQQASEQQSQMLQLFTAPDVRTVTASTPGGASGTVVVSQDADQALFVARGMPELPDNQVYELWTINDTPVPAGTFTPSGPASVVTLPPAAASADTIAVTVEPAGGSDQPTSDPIMAVSLT